MKTTCFAVLCLVAFAAGAASAATLTANGWALGESESSSSAGQVGSLATAPLDLVIVDLPQSIGTSHSSPLSGSVIRAAWLVDDFRPILDGATRPADDDTSQGVTREAALAALQVAISEVGRGVASDGVMSLSTYQTSALFGQGSSTPAASTFAVCLFGAGVVASSLARKLT